MKTMQQLNPDVNLTTNTQSVKCYHHSDSTGSWGLSWKPIPCVPLSCQYPPPGNTFNNFNVLGFKIKPMTLFSRVINIFVR